ncbi:MAG: hypothetical protein R2879_00230 [Saprospiraceae bacterium]
MMTKFYYAFFLFLLGISFQNIAAQDTIRLTNPSFEGLPGNGLTPKGWRDCGLNGESPPDIQPGGGFNVRTPPFEGVTYLGMVCRDNMTNEQVCQKLIRNWSRVNVIDLA